VQIGGYEVLGEIARGGQGAVYRVRDPRSGQEVALKVLLDLSDPDELERFFRESQATARLRHPNVVRVHGVGRDQGRPYLVMDLVEGASLAQRLQRSGPLSEREALRIVSEVTAAVQAAHSLGILHRDLKPANVLLQGERPLLADFGIAKVADARALTLTGEMLGTPGYMAPEQIRGDKARIGPATDVYGLGAILYACLTGAPPFQGASALATLDKALREDPTPPSQLRPELDRRLETICLRCLARDEAERYASAADLLDALEACATPAQAHERRVPRALGAGLALAALAGLAGLALLVPANTPTPSATPLASAATSASPPGAARARALLAEGRSHVDTNLTRAEACFRQALAADPGFHAARVELSLVHTTRFRLDEAERLLQGLSLEGLSAPARARLRFARGRLLIERGRRGEALAHFVRADELDHCAAYAAWRGFSRTPADAAQISVARDLDEHDPAVALLLLAATVQKPAPTPSECREALVFAEETLRRAPENPTLAALIARTRFISGKQEKALAEAEALRKRWPRHVSVLLVLSRIYSRLAQAEKGQARAAWLEKAAAILQEALQVVPLGRDLLLELGWLSRLRGRFAESYAAYEVLLREFPQDDWTSLNAWYTVATWLDYAAQTRDLSGLDLGPVGEQAWLLLRRLEASPETLRGTHFGDTPEKLARTKLWSKLVVARLYATQREWDRADEILVALEDRFAEQAQILEYRLLCRAERLRSSLLPDPLLAERQRGDLGQAKRFPGTTAAIEALWLGASADPPIWVEAGQVPQATAERYSLEAKRALRDALREKSPWSAQALAAWKQLVELEPNNLLARIAYCEALIEAKRFDEAIATCDEAPPPLQAEPHLIATWARATCVRGQAQDYPLVVERLSALLSKLPGFDLARARRMETYLLLDRPQDAKRDLELLRGRAPQIWFKDFETRIKVLLEFGG